MFTPVVIAEHNDISVHASPNQAAAFLDPADVRCGDCAAYDCEGNLLDVFVHSITEKHHFLSFKWERKVDLIHIDYHKPIENRKEELRRKLVEFLTSKEGTEPYQLMDVKELIDRASLRMPWMV